MSFVTTPLQLGILRFILGFADGAMLPAVQTLLLKYISERVTHFWLQPAVYVSGQCHWAVNWRVGIGDGWIPLGLWL